MSDYRFDLEATAAKRNFLSKDESRNAGAVGKSEFSNFKIQ